MKVLLLACALAVSACVAGAVFAAEPFSEPSQLDQLQAGYYRLKIGKINVIAVNDGAAIFDVLGVIPKEKKAATVRVLAKSLIKSPILSSVNAFVIFAGGRTIMVDAGTGNLFGVKLGKLPESLRAAGIQPDSITDILVTHIHPDHTGGLVVSGKIVFPNATLHVNRKELDFWTNKSAGDNASGPTKQYFGQVESTVGPYVTSGRVKLFEGETQVLPSIRSLPAYGHTPGHTFYALEDGGQTLVFMGDTIHAPDGSSKIPPSPSRSMSTRRRQRQLARRRSLTPPRVGTSWPSTTCIFLESDGSKRKVSATAGSPSHTSMTPPGREVRKRPLRPEDHERRVPNVTARFRGVLFGSIRR